MIDIMALVSDFFAGLESREKRALKIGALVLSAVFIVVLVCYLNGRPIRWLKSREIGCKQI